MTESDTAIAVGSGDVAVLATPRVVALVEHAAVLTLAGRLREGRTSVGIHVDLDHLAPSPVGAEVVAKATVTEIAGRRVTFAVQVEMAGEIVARGIHDRVVVEREGFGS